VLDRVTGKDSIYGTNPKIRKVIVKAVSKKYDRSRHGLLSYSHLYATFCGLLTIKLDGFSTQKSLRSICTKRLGNEDFCSSMTSKQGDALKYLLAISPKRLEIRENTYSLFCFSYFESGDIAVVSSIMFGKN